MSNVRVTWDRGWSTWERGLEYLRGSWGFVARKGDKCELTSAAGVTSSEGVRIRQMYIGCMFLGLS